MTRHHLARALGAAAALVLTLLPAGPVTAAPSDVQPALNDCWADFYARQAQPVPSVESLSLSPRSVDVSDGPATVEVTVLAGRPEARVGGGSAGFTTEVRYRAQTRDGYQRVELTPDPQDDHRLTGTLTVPQGASDYHLFVVGLQDDRGRFGPQQSYREDDPSGLVTVTSPADTGQPVIDSFTASPASVDTTRHSRLVRFTARVHDDESGVAEVATSGRGREVVHLVPTDDPDVWTGSTRIPRFIGPQTWRWGLLVTDRAGNVRGTVADDESVHPTVTIASGPEDRTPPRVATLRATPRPLDVRERDGKVVVRAHLTDAAAGVGAARVTTGGMYAEHDVPLELDSGTIHDGTWRGDLAVSACVGGSGDLGMSLEVEDRRGNWRTASATFPILARDRRQPVVDSFSRKRTPLQDFVVRFAEPVANIAAPHVAVSGGRHGDTVPGVWRCFHAHRRVSCASGAVLRAEFDPTEALRVGFYFVSFDADERHAVRDREGNPLTGHRGIDVVRP